MEFKSNSSTQSLSVSPTTERSSHRPMKRRRVSDSEEPEQELDEEITRARRSLAILEARKRLQSLDEERVRLLRALEALEGGYTPGVVSKEEHGVYRGGGIQNGFGYVRVLLVRVVVTYLLFFREGVSKGTTSASKSTVRGDEKGSVLSCNRCWQMGLECLRTKNPAEGCDACIGRGRICVLRRVGGAKKRKNKSEGK